MAVFTEASKFHDIKFGTDGWRALIAQEFTYENLHKLVDGLAEYLLENYPANTPLVIGYDARFLADRFASFAADKFSQDWGIPVKLINHPVPTPTIAHAAKEQNSCGALTFTASHNPPEYMGIKYIPEYAGPSSLEITQKIVAKIDTKAEELHSKSNERDAAYFSNAQSSAAISELDPAEVYLNDVRKIVNMDVLKKLNAQSPLKVIYDPIYGCGLGYANKLLEEAGFDVTTLHDKRDPTFGGALPDPSEKRLGELKAEVLKSGAIFGAANDGDADRFSYIDAEGNFYPANKSLTIIAKYLIEERGFKGTLARTVATTHLFDDLAAKTGNEVVETAVGFKWLCEIMRKTDTILAAEESGGMSVLGHIPEKDGIMAILLMAEVLAVTGKTLKQLWEEVQDFVGKKYFYHRLDLHIAGEGKKEFVKFFVEDTPEEVAGFKVERVDTTEGAKIYLDNGTWFLARPSGTEAMCRVYFESNNQDDLAKVAAAVEKITERF